jgi:hypothetical protein
MNLLSEAGRKSGNLSLRLCVEIILFSNPIFIDQHESGRKRKGMIVASLGCMTNKAYQYASQKKHSRRFLWKLEK